MCFKRDGKLTTINATFAIGPIRGEIRNPFLTAKLEMDLENGRCYVSLLARLLRR